MPYICKDCSKRFSSIGKLSQHRWKYHPDSINSKFRCQRCLLIFDNLSKLRVHQWEHMKEDGWVRKKKQRLLPAPKTVRDLRVATGPVLSNGEMTVSQLLVKLREQQKFLNDSVSMIDGILTHYNKEVRQ